MSRLVRFATVGVAGFVVDSGILWIAMHLLGLGPYGGRVVSFLAAATVTWWLNRLYTYSDRFQSGAAVRQWRNYVLASTLGAAANYLTYCACIVLLPVAARFPVIGVAAGSLASLIFNFTIYSRFVFRTTPAGT